MNRTNLPLNQKPSPKPKSRTPPRSERALKRKPTALKSEPLNPRNGNPKPSRPLIPVCPGSMMGSVAVDLLWLMCLLWLRRELGKRICYRVELRSLCLFPGCPVLAALTVRVLDLEGITGSPKAQTGTLPSTPERMNLSEPFPPPAPEPARLEKEGFR